MFGAVLASVMLTVVIGAVLAHRTASRENAQTISRRADLLAAEKGQRPSYIEEDYEVGQIRVIVDRLSEMATLLPPDRSARRPSEGKLSMGGERYLYAYRPIPPRGVLVLWEESAGAPIWGALFRDLLLAGLVGGALAGVISYVLAGSISRPVARVAAASRELAAGASPGPLPKEGPSELVALASAFDEMAHQLARSRENEQAFLLSVSHELKTPLTAIRGYTEGLTEGAFDEDEVARIILVEAARLERLVSDLLDLARMNRYEFSVRHEPVDLAHVVREAVARHERTANEFDVELVAEIEVDGKEAWVDADNDRVLQVASNLIENALRLTPAGGRVTVRAEPCRLIVSDTGPGLDPDDLPHAFDRFFLYDKYGRERPVGSGLGLAIVRQLATAMGGDVRVDSEPGAGATFTLVLPQGEATIDSTPAAERAL